MYSVSHHKSGPVQHNATTTAIVAAAAAAVAGSIATACLLNHSSPTTLLGRAQRWWQKQKIAAYEADEGQPWPAGGFPGPAKCRPISTVKELLTWQPPTQPPPPAIVDAADDSTAAQLHGVDPCRCSTLLPSRQRGCSVPVGCGRQLLHQQQEQQQQPQLLVCHDMQGGYLPEEVSLTGTAGQGHYRLWHWDCIDVFVYFSHHMVSIPPTPWIHAAHLHGTKVLGTFITEFGQGRQRCNRLFSTNQSAEAVADQLVAMAVHYGFEGWLVNIENPLTKEQVAVMQHFVGYLRACMRTVSNHGMVIWYDAVTVNGELRWQNKLSAANAPFFDLSDGLFLNYCWTPDTLPESVAAAGRRTADVYVGVDVHGRGCYGGGGHNTGLALAAAAAAGLSAALFAPGWVFENLECSRFAELQEQWWHKVQASWQYSHAVVHSLPFCTSFNAGAGLAWFRAGRLAENHQAGGAGAELNGAAAGTAAAASATAGCGDGWFNMLLTEALPSCRDPSSQQVISGPMVARLTASTAYNGGSCLVLCMQRQQAPQHQHQLDSKQAVATATGPAQAPCCSKLQLVMKSADALQHARLLVPLQLYKTAIPVLQDTVLQVKYVYAAPSGRSKSQASEPSAPLVWVMTDASGTTVQQMLQLQVNSQGTDTSNRMGPLEFVHVADHSDSGVAGRAELDGARAVAAAAAAAAALSADTLWTADLSKYLSGWEWCERSVAVDVPAGCTVSGIGVAVQESSSSSSGCEILGVIGQLEITTL